MTIVPCGTNRFRGSRLPFARQPVNLSARVGPMSDELRSIVMRERWLTIAEAAAAMKVHPRTVERRIAAGKIDSRRNDDGQIEVVVNLAAAEPATEPTAATSPLETVREMADRQVDLAAGSASALVRVAQEQAMRSENQLMLARQDAGRYRREAHMALVLVGVMFVLIVIGVGWGMSTVTTAKVTAQSAAEKATDAVAIAQQRVNEAAASVKQLQDNYNVVRNQLDEAVVAGAKAQGELVAYKSTLSPDRAEHPRRTAASQPTNLIERFGELFTGERPQ